MMKRRFICIVCGLALTLPSWAAKPTSTVKTNNEVILHAWCWSFNTIRENMKAIADAGFTIVQTPPAQLCVTETKGDKGGGNKLFGEGYWYYHYQPTDWKIGNYQVGTRNDFKALCDEAKKYGVRIIVDVLPNHTSIDDTRTTAELDAAVGGHKNLYHQAGFTEIKNYNDRLQCTTGQMGGLPDVNTENPDFQFYYMTYVNDLIQLGCRGFRYDTAKHIGLPSDPKDPKSPENDFWDVAMGRKAVKGLKLALPEDSLFIYGEVLQDKNVKETEYAEYMQLTASNYGYIMREALQAGKFDTTKAGNWYHPVDPYKLISWVESHDTYCNAHESANLTNDQIRAAWAWLAARQFSTPLFYSRPNNSSPENVWGDNIVGARGNDQFIHPEVAAVNKFRKAMSGLAETLHYSADAKVGEVCRGKKGAMLVNFSADAVAVNMPTTLPNGKYIDPVHGSIFKVKKGVITGKVAPLASYVLVKK